MMGQSVTRVLLERGSARITAVLTPHVGETAARFHADRIARTLVEAGGDAERVASTILPLPPADRRRVAELVAKAWTELALGLWPAPN